jgi:hypothetical protein
LQVPHPFAKIGQLIFGQEIAQQMYRTAVELSGKLNAADQFYAGRLRQRFRLFVPAERVVVGDPEDTDAAGNRLFDELAGRAGPIGLVSV